MQPQLWSPHLVITNQHWACKKVPRQDGYMTMVFIAIYFTSWLCWKISVYMHLHTIKYQDDSHCPWELSRVHQTTSILFYPFMHQGLWITFALSLLTEFKTQVCLGESELIEAPCYLLCVFYLQICIFLFYIVLTSVLTFISKDTNSACLQFLCTLTQLYWASSILFYPLSCKF